MQSSSLPQPNKAQREYHRALIDLGCIVCLEHYGDLYTPPEIHHMLDGGRRISHMHVLPLCTRHHRVPGRGYEARHSVNGKSGKAAFERRYGTEEWLLRRTIVRLNRRYELFERKPRMNKTTEGQPVPVDRMLIYFHWQHLPENLQAASKPFGKLAAHLCATVPAGPERTVALRKLLESKDAAVRAVVFPER